MIELSATGVQVYVRVPGQFAWTLKEPIADLFDAAGKQVGTHFRDAEHGGARQAE